MGKRIEKIKAWFGRNLFGVMAIVFAIAVLFGLSGNSIGTFCAAVSLLIMAWVKVSSSRNFFFLLLYVIAASTLVVFFCKWPPLASIVFFSLLGLGYILFWQGMLAIFASCLFGIGLSLFCEQKAGFSTVYSVSYLLAHYNTIRPGVLIGELIAFSILGLIIAVIIRMFIPIK